jgi:transcriptional regulator with XRE-family HTH domain
MSANQSSDELEQQIGASLKHLRLGRNIGQRVLAERAGVSTRALQSLENGEGSSLRTLVQVLRALGREDWLQTIAPLPTINPMNTVRHAAPRQRARRVAHSEFDNPVTGIAVDAVDSAG